MGSVGTRHRWFGAVLASLAITTHAATAQVPVPPRVEANHELLIGSFGDRHPHVASFKGIPFAAPPTGELRWREPQPHTPRQGPQRADRFAPGCFQDSYNMDWYRRVGAAFGASPSLFVDPPFSEDCLYLNVWTPRLDSGARLPVLVWIYGGSNRAGWSFEPNYAGEQLAARGRIIVVTVAYRVGIFGFFGHPSLRGARAPANFGLLDQVAALRWVNAHIAQFGGDPGNVTIAGESAGASDIGYLVSAPAAQGLFRRAISQSGGFQMQDRYGLSEAEATGIALSAALPGSPDLAAMRGLPSREIWEAALRALPGHDYAPVVDGISVLEAPAAAYARRGIPHDLLIGSNEDEWYMYVDGDPQGLAKDLDAFAPGARGALEARAAREPDVRTARDKVGTLVNMLCPAYLMADASRAAGHRSWVYHFTRVRPGPGGGELRAYHGAEIPYVFGTHDAWLPTDAVDSALTGRMIDFWASFARTGNPNGDPAEVWPPFDPANPRVMELGDRIGPMAAKDHDFCRQWAATLYPGWNRH